MANGTRTHTNPRVRCPLSGTTALRKWADFFRGELGRICLSDSVGHSECWTPGQVGRWSLSDAQNPPPPSVPTVPIRRQAWRARTLCAAVGNMSEYLFLISDFKLINFWFGARLHLFWCKVVVIIPLMANSAAHKRNTKKMFKENYFPRVKKAKCVSHNSHVQY